MDGEPGTFDAAARPRGRGRADPAPARPAVGAAATRRRGARAWLRAARRARGAVARRRREVLRRRRDRRRHRPGWRRRTPTATGRRRSGPTRSGWRPRWRVRRAGFQLATHTIGDAGRALHARRLRRAGGRGHRLEHLETLPDELVQRGRARGRDRLDAARAPERASTAELERAARAGARGACVPHARRCSTRARRSRSAATGRWARPTRGWRHGIAARRHGLTGEEALAGYTLAPARAVGEAGGRIRVGLRADLTGMAEDPVRAPDAPVWLTVVAGGVVHLHGDVVARRLRPVAAVVP